MRRLIENAVSAGVGALVGLIVGAVAAVWLMAPMRRVRW